VEPIRVSIATDFSLTPGPRYRIEGDFSGQEFRETILKEAMENAIIGNRKLVMNLDGTAGYGTSFLEEAFGGLIREDNLSFDLINKCLEIISEEEPFLIDDVKEYLQSANVEKLKTTPKDGK